MTTRTRSTPLIRTDQIIEELFTRSLAGVYGRYRQGRPVIARHGPFIQQLGLSLLIEHKQHGQPSPQRIQRTNDSASEGAWRSGQLDLLTTGELLTRLSLRPGPWVLGLTLRHPKRKQFQAGTFHRGDRMTCAGLAGHLGWQVAREALRYRMRQKAVPSKPTDAVRDLTEMIMISIDDRCPRVMFNCGLPILLEHALLATMESKR